MFAVVGVVLYPTTDPWDERFIYLLIYLIKVNHSWISKGLPVSGMSHGYITYYTYILKHPCFNGVSVG